jgi:hypothetical protein
MKRREPGLDPEWRAFLNPRRVERHLPPEIRARVLARGRAIIATGGAIPPTPLREVQTAMWAPVPVRRVRLLVRISLAASVALAAGAVGAVVALHGQSVQAPPSIGQRPIALLDSSAREPAPRPVLAAPAVASARTVTVKSTHPRRGAGEADLFTAELELLQRAHAAYTRHQFSSALALIGEHTQRFPKGRLAEQREALRVRSLLDSGRTDEGHRAAAAFAVRFPRSILLPGAHDREPA